MLLGTRGFIYWWPSEPTPYEGATIVRRVKAVEYRYGGQLFQNEI